MRQFAGWTRLASASGSLVWGVIFFGFSAAAHDWYAGQVNERGELCCGGGDCSELPDPPVRHTHGGYDVDILPGTHPMVRTDDWRQCYYGGAYCTEFIGMHTRSAVTFHFEGSPGTALTATCMPA